MGITAAVHARPLLSEAWQVDAVELAMGRLDESMTTIRGLVASHGDEAPDSVNFLEASKGERIRAYHLNMAGQELLGGVKRSGPRAVGDVIDSARQRMMDANWQLAKRTSPDRRFTGVDLDGALRDSQAAVDLLRPLTGRPTPAVAATTAEQVAAALDPAASELAHELRSGLVRELSPTNVAVVHVASGVPRLVMRETIDASRGSLPTGYAQVLAADLRNGTLRELDSAAEAVVFDLGAGMPRLVARDVLDRAVAS